VLSQVDVANIGLSVLSYRFKIKINMTIDRQVGITIDIKTNRQQATEGIMRRSFS